MSTEQSSPRECVCCGAKPRLLFCSYHCYWDPSSGAALCARELLELLAGRGWECRVFCGAHIDFEQPPTLTRLLSAHRVRFAQRDAKAGALPVTIFDFQHAGVGV